MFKQTHIHRLHIISGHLKKVEEMIGEDRNFLVIHQQIKAVRNALKREDESLLKEYLQDTCNSMFKQDKHSQKIKDELLTLFNRSIN